LPSGVQAMLASLCDGPHVYALSCPQREVTLNVSLMKVCRAIHGVKALADRHLENTSPLHTKRQRSRIKQIAIEWKIRSK